MSAGPQEVNYFHQNSDCDSSDRAQHHTLGLGTYQAMPGGKIVGRRIVGSISANRDDVILQIAEILGDLGVDLRGLTP